MALAQVVQNPPQHWPVNTVILKAGDITEPGYYWYFGRPSSVWEVCRAIHNRDETGIEFLFAGSEFDFSARECPGDFIGPLAQPA